MVLSVAKVCWKVVLILLFANVAFAGVGQWKTYTAKNEVRDATRDNRDSSLIWVATSGGMFSYNLKDSSFHEFTTSEGLRTTDLTAITTDKNGNIWVGAGNGFVHRYSPTTGDWLYITDLLIDRDHGPSKRINKMSIIGDTLFILSDIGVSIFSLSRLEFGDSYTRYGSGPSPITGNVTAMQVYENTLWIATRNGIVSTPVANPNPTAPETWQVFGTAQGLPSNDVNALEIINGQLSAGTANGIAAYNGSIWTALPGTLNKNIIEIKFFESVLDSNASGVFFITTDQLWKIAQDGSAGLITQFNFTLSALLLPSIIGTGSNGLMIQKNLEWHPTVPPGPPSNKFVSIQVDKKGLLWSATGSANGEGFMSFDGNRWKSYSVQKDSRLGSNNYYKVSIGKDNSKWISNWGAGVALLDGDGVVQKIFNTKNGLPRTLDDDTVYIVVGGVMVDQNGVTWITNRTAPDSTAIVLMKADSTLDYSVRRNMRTNPPTIFSDLIADGNGTKWFANSGRFDHEQPQGLFFYNDVAVQPGIQKGWGKMTIDNGLTSNSIWSLAVDHNGELWIGTDQGVTIIFNTADPIHTIASYHPQSLSGQTAQAIVSDACDNKWVATKKGVFVLSPDGTSMIDRYTKDNTDGKLLDDDVASISIDPASGIIYFGTEKGLSSLKTAAVNPLQSFNELIFKPNPYYVPSAAQLTVDGLVYSSSLKVLSISGDLVKDITCPCGRVGFWDGTNQTGDPVSTGIYVIVAYASDGTQVAVGKLAVIRK